MLRPDLPAARAKEDPDALRESISDRPGVASDTAIERALEFAAACGNEFEAVYRINAQGRSHAGMLGDIGHRMELVLPDALEENRNVVIRHCRDHRVLLICENVQPGDRDFIVPGGRASVIFTDPSPAPAFMPDDIAAAFFASPRDTERCAELLGAASVLLTELLQSDFESGLRLGWAVVAVLKSLQRFAETVETLEAMQAAARECCNALAIFRIEWEQSWLREVVADGTTRVVPPPPPETQLTLPFA